MVHLSEAAGVRCHVAQDDVSPAIGEQLQQLGVRGGVGDILKRQEVGAVQRRYVQQIDANDCTTWELWF